MEIQQPAKRPFMGFTMILLVLMGVGIASGYFLFKPTRTLSVSGVGRESTQANKATVTFAFTVKSGSKDQAATSGEQEFNDLLNVINNFQPSDVKRVAYQVQPLANSLGTPTGEYQYVSGASVTVEGATNIASLTRALSTNNAQVVSLRYLPDDEEGVNEKTRLEAIANARQKAQQIAKASGGRVGKVLSVSEQSSTGETGSSVTSVQTDSFNQVEVQSVLTVTFELTNWLGF